MANEGFWLFDGLEDEPYGILPLVNLSAKGGASSTKSVDRVGSYQWYLDVDEPVVIVPGMPPESFYWPGGRISQDHGVLLYNVNHLKVKNGALDAAILAAKLLSSTKKPINFDEYDFITDAVNLQKLFAFAQEAGDGLFRIDCERVGKTVLLNRMEASDLMEIGHLTFDQAMKAKMTKPRSKHCTGPFFQLVSYVFGQFKMLVRYEVDCADFAAAKAVPTEEAEQLPEKHTFEENPTISYVAFGNVPKEAPLQLVTTYPQGAGFPFFTWAQLFFTCTEQEVVGFFKGNGDFGKPAIYGLNDVSKLMKPLPYAVLSKVHDCLHKIKLFLIRNDPDFRFALIWKGKAHLEIFAKHAIADGAVSPSVRELLATQCKEPTAEDIPSRSTNANGGEQSVKAEKEETPLENTENEKKPSEKTEKEKKPPSEKVKKETKPSEGIEKETKPSGKTEKKPLEKTEKEKKPIEKAEKLEKSLAEKEKKPAEKPEKNPLEKIEKLKNPIEKTEKLEKTPVDKEKKPAEKADKEKKPAEKADKEKKPAEKADKEKKPAEKADKEKKPAEKADKKPSAKK